MRQTDLRTAYAHLGIHPGDLGPQEAQIVFNEGMGVNESGVFVEINPAAGRATVILGIAAKNINGRLYVLDNWPTKNPQESRWFELAVMLHRLQDTIVRCDIKPEAFREIINGSGVDLALVNGEFEFLPSLPLKDGAKIIKRRSPGGVDNAECLVDHRPLISVWKSFPVIAVSPENLQTLNKQP